MKSPPEIKILVVEDDAYFRRVLVKRLEAEGYQVFTASDGREGMKSIVTQDPDLVISDWMMPHVDGLELCQSIKTGLKEAAPYFILLTAKGEIDDRLLGLDTGADDYLVKPCEQGEIMARVRAGLRNVLLTRELRERVAELQAMHTELDETRAETRRLTALTSCPRCRTVRTSDGRPVDLLHYLSDARLLRWSEDRCPDCDATSSETVEEQADVEG